MPTQQKSHRQILTELGFEPIAESLGLLTGGLTMNPNRRVRRTFRAFTGKSWTMVIDDRRVVSDMRGRIWIGPADADPRKHGLKYKDLGRMPSIPPEVLARFLR